MPNWLIRTRDARAPWGGDPPEPGGAATAQAPVAWIARSVLEAIGHSAEYGHPHLVDGELLGYWSIPDVELVVVDWSGFGSLLFREPYAASTGLCDELGAPLPTSDAPCIPLGVWSTGPVARVLDESRHVLPAPSVGESMPMIHLLLERERAWHARLTMMPRSRWRRDAFRRPREMELRVVPPQT